MTCTASEGGSYRLPVCAKSLYRFVSLNVRCWKVKRVSTADRGKSSAGVIGNHSRLCLRLLSAAGPVGFGVLPVNCENGSVEGHPGVRAGRFKFFEIEPEPFLDFFSPDVCFGLSPPRLGTDFFSLRYFGKEFASLLFFWSVQTLSFRWRVGVGVLSRCCSVFDYFLFPAPPRV